MKANLKLSIIFAVMLLIGGLQSVIADESVVQAEEVVSGAQNWSDLHKAFIRFGKNADGVVAGAFTDKVSWLLAERWGSLNELRLLAIKDKRFEKFVLQNLNEAVPADRAKKIFENAERECSLRANVDLCQKIIKSLGAI
jgi:hypothetical protein